MEAHWVILATGRSVALTPLGAGTILISLEDMSVPTLHQKRFRQYRGTRGPVQ
jgi:hypothetical protein